MQIKQGDLFPDVEVIVKDEAGVVVDLTSVSSVVFSMRSARDPSVVKVNAAAGVVVSPGTNGRIRYAWSGTDTDTPGTYEGEFRVTLPAADPFRVPTTGYITINVEPKIGA